MKILAFLLAVFVAMILVNSAECWRRRRFRVRVRVRRIIKTICSPVCSTACTYVTNCPKCAPICKYGCKKVCRGKREAKHELPTNSFIKLMPCDFDTYDTNNNAVISLQELGRQNGETGNEEDVKQMFSIMDVNNDGDVSKAEFEAAPLLKDCDKSDIDSNEPEVRSLEPELAELEDEFDDLE